MRRFKDTWYLLKTPLMIGALLGLLIGNIIAIGRLSDISKQIQTQAETNQAQVKTAQENSETQTQRIIDHLDCIVEFFTRPDFAKSYIQSIDDCVIAKQETQASQSRQSETPPQSPPAQSTPQTPPEQSGNQEQPPSPKCTVQVPLINTCIKL